MALKFKEKIPTPDELGWGNLITTLVRIFSFGSILQHLSCLCIHTDLLSDFTVPDVEGIAQTAATCFLLQFLIGDLARVCLERDGASFLDAEFC